MPFALKWASKWVKWSQLMRSDARQVVYSRQINPPAIEHGPGGEVESTESGTFPPWARPRGRRKGAS